MCFKQLNLNVGLLSSKKLKYFTTLAMHILMIAKCVQKKGYILHVA